MIKGSTYQIISLIGQAHGSMKYKDMKSVFNDYIDPVVRLIQDLDEKEFREIKYDVGKDLSNLRATLLTPLFLDENQQIKPPVKNLFRSLDSLLEIIYPEYIPTD